MRQRLRRQCKAQPGRAANENIDQRSQVQEAQKSEGEDVRAQERVRGRLGLEPDRRFARGNDLPVPQDKHEASGTRQRKQPADHEA